MEFKTIVAVDAMGGDNAPMEIVKGAVDAVNARPDLKVRLFGDQDKVNAELARYEYRSEQIEVTHTTEVIIVDEPPVNAVRKKKDSSLVRAITSVKDGECDAVLSAGSSGAVLVGGQIIVGKGKGVKRAPLAPIIPNEKGVSLLIDCGANVDARPEHLVQFAQMGSIYMEHVVGVKNPRVAIVNIGAEEEKGNALVKETFPLLKECSNINFTGNIEARDIPKGAADVIVTEAFTGNVILKLYEGLSKMILKEIKARLNDVVAEMNLDELLGRSIFDLSGGQKQRIACASVAALLPDIILLDEPSSNLDFDSIELLRGTILEWKRQGKTIIISEHRLWYLKDAVDRVIYMENGVMAKEWTGEEFKGLNEEEVKSYKLRPIVLEEELIRDIRGESTS